MKAHPFMLKVPAIHFNKVEVGQHMQIEDQWCNVTKIISVKMIAGDMLEVFGMCKNL